MSVVSYERYKNRYWVPHQSFKFASSEVVVPLSLSELGLACMRMPLAFQRTKQGMCPVAVVGFDKRNLYLSPTGLWLGGHIPVAYRSYPFYLLTSESGSSEFCVHESDSNVVDNPSQGAVPFYDEYGHFSDQTKKVFDFLFALERERTVSLNAARLLEEMELLVTWPIHIRLGSGAVGQDDVTLKGFFEVDMSRFNDLSASSLKKLQAAGALSMIYSQVYSKYNLASIPHLFTGSFSSKALATPVHGLQANQTGEIDFSFLKK